MAGSPLYSERGSLAWTDVVTLIADIHEPILEGSS
jgi:hypothetical protein